MSWGRYFGYPDCCIRDFESRSRAPKEPRKLHGTGYIPCPTCNMKSEEELIQAIDTKRQHDKPFPNDIGA